MDADKDGKLTPAEYARTLIIKKPVGDSQKESTVAPAPKKKPVPMEDGAEIDPRYLKYATGKIAEQDFNKDGVLTKEEWSKSSAFKDEMDADKDGKLTPAEYARTLMRR